MKQSEIKIECDMLYAKIKSANERLIKLRKICTHPNTFIGNYSYRIGSIITAEICEDCGEFIKAV